MGMMTAAVAAQPGMASTQTITVVDQTAIAMTMDQMAPMAGQILIVAGQAITEISNIATVVGVQMASKS